MNLAYCMDCMDALRQMPDKYFDLAVVDPPYGLPKDSTNGAGKLKDRALNRGNISVWDTPPDDEYFEELFRVSKNQIIWGVITSPCRRVDALLSGTNYSPLKILAAVSMRGQVLTSRQSCLLLIIERAEKSTQHRNRLNCIHTYLISLQSPAIRYSTLI